MSQPYDSYEALLIALYPIFREAFARRLWLQEPPSTPRGRLGDDEFYFTVVDTGGGADPWGGGESWGGLTFTSPEGVIFDCGYHDISLAGRYYHYKCAIHEEALALQILRISTRILYRREPTAHELKSGTIHE